MKVPTADEYIKEHPYVCSFLSSAQGYEVLIEFMTDFAKLHVQAALKAASEAADYEADGQEYIVNVWIDRDSILDSYPLENIK